ncbi:hypothetical protein A8W25_21755 [Streptomyces sp. ERV7]|uniref:hypothetical protein n=1 Tax=Streptomyces sp. ERV7 TaxID=1322334 RepID=UPI0007F4F6CA|nr:hypothetical protein [Streptomyces sp. ERV7]OAR22298.1 hypothetical protein A8W25_21755 [Streptomyces sp. ERV7]
MSEQSDYFGALTEKLRAGGMRQSEVAATVAELTGYLAESGSADPYEEFGAPEDFAARLTGGRAAQEPGAEAETWKWTADIYTDRKHLNHYGDQGWEVEGLDRVGRFVCRRDPAAAMRWEYRRESANSAAERESVTAGLAPDGWEPCGQWMFFMYFKRPKAASAGPAAGLDELVAPPAKQLFLSGMYRGKLKQMIAAGVASGTVTALAIHYAGEGAAYGALIGAAVTLPVALVLAWQRVKREVAKGVEDPGPIPRTAA